MLDNVGTSWAGWKMLILRIYVTMFEEIDVYNAFFPNNRLPSINPNISFDKSFSKRDLLGTEQLTKRCLKCVFYLHRFYHGSVYIFHWGEFVGGAWNISFFSNFPTMETFVFLRQWWGGGWNKGLPSTSLPLKSLQFYRRSANTTT